MTQFNLSPSDFGFLWRECRRCYYLKVARKFTRPSSAFPKIFTQIASIEKKFFDGKSTKEISPLLPPGQVIYGEKQVCSAPITFPGLDGSFYISGRFDNVVRFDDGSYGVIDFKTSSVKEYHIERYSRQLHAYAYCLEHPAENALSLSPITKFGICCLEPKRMFSQGEEFGFMCEVAWLECPRDDAAFMELLREVLALLLSPDSPAASEKCGFCRYRAATGDTTQ